MHILSQFIEIFLLGLVAGALPGPILTAVFTGVLNGGFKQGVQIIVKALIAETIIATIALFFVFSLNISSAYFNILTFIGAIFLIYLASKIWKMQFIDGQYNKIFPFSKILVLTILSGAFWIFWLTVCIPQARALNEYIYAGQFLFILIFEFAWLIATSLLAYIFSKFRPMLFKKNLVSPVFKIFALLLVFFAAKSLISAVT